MNLNGIEKKALDRGIVTAEEMVYIKSHGMWFARLHNHPDDGTHLVLRSHSSCFDDTDIGIGWNPFTFEDEGIEKEYSPRYWFAGVREGFDKQFTTLTNAIKFTVNYLEKDLKKKIKELEQFK